MINCCTPFLPSPFEELFEVETKEIKSPVNFCRTCVHKENWQCGGSVFKYCGLRKSNRTNNGQLKIKDKTPACLSYKENEKNSKK
jgi:hypothetical protein